MEILFFCFLLLIKYGYSEIQVENDHNFDKYLNYPVENLRSQIKKTISRLVPKSRGSFISHEHFEKVSVLETPDGMAFTYIFNAWNETYLLNWNEIRSIKKDENDRLIFPIVSSFKYIDNVLLAKTVYFDNNLFLMIAFSSGICNIYSNSGTLYPWVLRQSVINSKIAADVHFFENGNNLYLIIANKNEQYLVPSVIYQWVGTHFDEVERILTTGVTSVTTINNSSGVLIIVTQYVADLKTIGTGIFSFHLNKLRRLQFLDTDKAIFAVPYTYHNEHYVFIQSDKLNANVYLVKENYLIKYGTVYDSADCHKIFFFSIQNMMFAFMFSKNSIIIHQIENEGFLKIGNIPVKNSSLSDMALLSQENNSFLFLLTMYDEEKIKSYMTTMVLKYMFADSYTDKEHELVCLNNIYYKAKLKLDSLIKVSTNDQSTVDSLSSWKENSLEKFVYDLQFKLNNIKIKLNALKSSQIDDEEVLKKYIFDGNLTINNLFLKNLNVKKVNSKQWTPEKWFMNNISQNITASATFRTIVTDNLKIVSNFLKEILLLKGNQIFLGNIVLNSFRAYNAFVNQINSIPVNKIVTRQNNVIEGQKQFVNLITSELYVANWNQIPMKVSVSEKNKSILFYSNINAESITTGKINGIPWEEFIDSLFLHEKNKIIKGDLIFQSQLQVNNLFAEEVMNVSTSELMTINTDQTISSNIHISVLTCKNLNATTLNGINFQEQVVLSNGHDTLIKGPVSFYNLNIKKHVVLKRMNSSDNDIGENDLNFLQIYTKPVKIKGSLLIKNIKFNRKAPVFSSGIELMQDYSKIYWMKNIDQQIDVPITFLNNVTCDEISTEMLNGLPFVIYAQETGATWAESPTIFNFENVRIKGNITLDIGTMIKYLNLRELVASAVRTSGSYIVTGPIIFKDVLYVSNLTADNLNNITKGKFLRKGTDLSVLKGNKIFKNIIIDSIYLQSDDIEYNIYNGVSLNEWKKSMVMIKESSTVRSLNFNTVKAKNITVETIDGINFNEFIEILHRSEFQMNSLIVDANVVVKNLTIEKINGKILDTYISRIVQKSSKIIVSGKKIFTRNISVFSLESFSINGLSFQDLYDNYLSKSRPQIITAKHTFMNIKTSWANVNTINNISLSNLLWCSSTNPQIINVNTLHINSVNIKGSLITKMLNGDISNIDEHLLNLFEREWGTVIIEENVKLTGEENNLSRLLKLAVCSDRNQNITGQVTYKKSVSVDNINSVKYINDINIFLIEDDAVLKNRNKQVIKGDVIFLKDVQALGVTVLGNSIIETINDINMENLNRSMVRLGNTERIYGKKIFYVGIKVNDLKMSEEIMQLSPKMLVSYKDNILISSSIFSNLTVIGDLYIKNINEYNFSEFLNSRMLLSSGIKQEIHSKCLIDQLHLKEETAVYTLNDIFIEDVVKDDGMLTIKSNKIFTKSIVILGEMKIENLNEVSLIGSYNNAIFYDEDADLSGSVVFHAPVYINTYFKTNYLNLYSVNNLDNYFEYNYILAAETSYYINNVENHLQEMKITNNESTGKYLYLEVSKDIHIPIYGVVSGHVLSTDNYVTLNLIGEISGSFCGLPKMCPCPQQHTVNLMSSGSVNVLINQSSAERIFSSNENDNNHHITINIITNTISTSSVCRLSNDEVKDEISHISWIKKSDLGQDYIHIYNSSITGYLSDVKLFQINGQSYIVISRFYDAISDNYDLDCIVFKLNHEMGIPEPIQTITCSGAWSLDVMYSAQGVVLIIGSLYNSDMNKLNVKSYIYRFDSNLEKFILLRSVDGKGVKAVRGIVLCRNDSLVVLGQQTSTLVVLKYWPDYDNYYFYQNIYFDSPITSINVIYMGADAFLCATTKDGSFYIYTYQYIQGLILESSGEIENLTTFVPYKINGEQFIFASSINSSEVIQVIKQSYY